MTTPTEPSLFTDGCPACVATYQEPQATMPGCNGGVVCSYECPCGHRWDTWWQAQRGEHDLTPAAVAVVSLSPEENQKP